jgi:hypothetical protein
MSLADFMPEPWIFDPGEEPENHTEAGLEQNRTEPSICGQAVRQGWMRNLACD